MSMETTSAQEFLYEHLNFQRQSEHEKMGTKEVLSEDATMHFGTKVSTPVQVRAPLPGTDESHQPPAHKAAPNHQARYSSCWSSL